MESTEGVLAPSSMEKGVVCSAVLSAGADGPRVVWNERKEAATFEPDATLDTGNLIKPY